MTDLAADRPAEGSSSAAAWVRLHGSGPVALACALFLVRRGVPSRVIQLDSWTQDIPAILNQRILALSEGSLQLLDRVCGRPDGGRIRTVEVSMQGHLGRTLIRADELGVPALGAVMRYPAVLASLRQAALAHVWSSPPAQDALGTDGILQIHADGDPGPQARAREFDQLALLAEVHAPAAPADAPGTAHERFTPRGPLALLPLPEPGRWAMVWCDQPEHAQRRLAANDTELSRELEEAFGRRLGPLVVQGPRQAVPLVRKARQQIALGTEIWIGNAAQSLHPVAGQGLNLGLRDAFELAEQLGECWRTGQSSLGAVSAWGAMRRRDRDGLIGLTDLMASSFGWTAARPFQSLFLGALDMVGPARRTLARTLMFGLR
ncbi:MAG: FAD-dependent monooxygenase [Burkholderiaceae bacterium]